MYIIQAEDSKLGPIPGSAEEWGTVLSTRHCKRPRAHVYRKRERKEEREKETEEFFCKFRTLGEKHVFVWTTILWFHSPWLIYSNWELFNFKETLGFSLKF